MDIYLGGTHQKMWRTLLQVEGIEHAGLSYMGLRGRIKDPSNWRVADQYEGQQVFLDSGAATLNRKEDQDADEVYDIAQMYMDFVDANLDGIAFASEFDATVLGHEVIEQMRVDFWNGLPADKWMPIWHSETGPKELERLANTYARVGVLQSDSSNLDISALLRKLSAKTLLHGVSMTSMQSMQSIPWSSAATTSWLNVTQYGETFVWTGREMKWYPKREKDKARKRHRTWLQDQGFDVELIEADDNAELLRLSIWSWKNFAESLQQERGVTTTDILRPFGNEEITPPVVETLPGETRNAELVPSRTRKLLPVLGVTTHTSVDKDGNEVEERRLSTPSSGLLRCDNCFMREKCPEMQPGHDCAFEIPAQVRTGSQLAAVQDWMIETQTQRVAFMRLIEQVEGGYADNNLSTEMDRLAKMIKNKQDVGKEGFSINIANVAGPSGPGIMAGIFGAEVTAKMGELPAAVDTSDIVDAEIVTDRHPDR